MQKEYHFYKATKIEPRKFPLTTVKRDEIGSFVEIEFISNFFYKRSFLAARGRKQIIYMFICSCL